MDRGRMRLTSDIVYIWGLYHIDQNMSKKILFWMKTWPKIGNYGEITPTYLYTDTIWTSQTQVQ